eukprot:1621660-Amphidinium_carterae.1
MPMRLLQFMGMYGADVLLSTNHSDSFYSESTHTHMGQHKLGDAGRTSALWGFGALAGRRA